MQKRKLRKDPDLNMIPETTKLQEENVCSELLNVSIGVVSGYVSLGEGNKSKSKQVGLRQAKCFCTAKDNHPQYKKATY